MMPPNYDYSNPPRLYLGNSTTPWEYDQIPTLRVTTPEDMHYELFDDWLPLDGATFEVSIKMTCNKYRMHRLMGWRGRMAYRPRYKQRLRAWKMMRKVWLSA